MDLSYQEQQEKLNTRIRAHKEFANFDVKDWIDDFLAKRKRKHIFDLGCGNGNHLGLYLKHIASDGTVSGLDREPKLVEEARNRYRDAPNLRLTVASMDDPLPYENEAFDTCLSIFAIYNAEDPEQLLEELKRIMKTRAELVIVGPTRNNARELYEYNERLTGQAIDEVTLIRTDRVRQEILPLVERVFRDVKTDILNSVLTFPTRNEFIKYFQATMLYEQVAEKQGVTQDQLVGACAANERYVVSKEMLAVVASKEG
jgi:ubiquinone/menaquinone biosynthesis C-methylase UbiE